MFSRRTSTMDINPQGNNKNVEGLEEGEAMVKGFVVTWKIENIRQKMKKSF